MPDDKNYFLYRKLFPDNLAILQGEELDRNKFSETAIFVIDTNSLLAPYNTGKDSLDDIKKIYTQLIADSRLFIPGHVLKEFAKTRSLKISDLFTVVDNALSSLPSVKDIKFPILGELEAYKKLESCKSELEAKTKEYKATLKELQEGIYKWNWFDPVTKIYNEIFDEKIIIENQDSEDALIKEFVERTENNIPPGFRDKNKGENGIGDFLIWKCILELGKSKNANIVFVSNDEKNDWLLKGNKKSISTRFELVDEYYRFTGGRRFICMNFTDFVEIQGAQRETILELEKIFEVANSELLEFAETETITGFNTMECLREIESIVSAFIDEDEEEYQDNTKYIEPKAFGDLVKMYHNNWSNEYFGTPKWNYFYSRLSFIDQILKKMASLNGEIQYQAYRMKRDTRLEQFELDKLAHEFLDKVSELRK